jgi:5-methylcytosine-specific restriction protein A
MPNDAFYKTPEWRRLRARALARDRHRCVFCGADLRPKGTSRVDHIKPRRAFPTLALVLENLRCLCASCDNKRHTEKHIQQSAAPGARLDGTPLDPSHPWNQE